MNMAGSYIAFPVDDVIGRSGWPNIRVWLNRIVQVRRSKRIECLSAQKTVDSQRCAKSRQVHAGDSIRPPGQKAGVDACSVRCGWVFARIGCHMKEDRMELGMIGLGRMGASLVRRLACVSRHSMSLMCVVPCSLSPLVMGAIHMCMCGVWS